MYSTLVAVNNHLSHLFKGLNFLAKDNSVVFFLRQFRLQCKNRGLSSLSDVKGAPKCLCSQGVLISFKIFRFEIFQFDPEASQKVVNVWETLITVSLIANLTKNCDSQLGIPILMSRFAKKIFPILIIK